MKTTNSLIHALRSHDLTFFYVILLALVVGGIVHIAAQPTAVHAKPPWVTNIHAGVQTMLGGNGTSVSAHRNGGVTICHIPPGNPDAAHTKTVGAPAAQKHLAHGDTRGACEEDGEIPEDTTSPEIANLHADDVSTSTVTIRWNTDEPADSAAYVSTTSPVDPNTAMQEHSDATTTDHATAFSSLSASTTYHYFVTSTDEAGNTATSSEQSFVTEPLVDTAPPAISDVTASTSPTTADITWNTDESASSTLLYASSSPVSYDNALGVVSSPGDMNHAVSLHSLVASSTYFFSIVATDTEGNTATSTGHTFTTEPAPDETAPIISDLSATSTASTTAEVTWDTDEPADSIVYYSTSSPVSLATFVHNAPLTLNHLVDLVGLAASTTYHYFVTSTDEAGNTATSSEQSFITPSD